MIIVIVKVSHQVIKPSCCVDCEDLLIFLYTYYWKWKAHGCGTKQTVWRCCPRLGSVDMWQVLHTFFPWCLIGETHDGLSKQIRRCLLPLRSCLLTVWQCRNLKETVIFLKPFWRWGDLLNFGICNICCALTSCSLGCRVHYGSVLNFLNCVVLFDANGSLYFVIGCGGFKTRTQPRYSSSSKAKGL